MKRVVACLGTGAVILACAETAPPSSPVAPPRTLAANPAEPHLAELRQLTQGGENAEAYWASSGRELIMQSRGNPANARFGEHDCDRIYRMDATSGAMTPVSDGKGATTCSYFFPGDRRVLFASTGLGGAACPPKPDHSQGYVWPLYDTYDIFASDPDGKNPTRLTEGKGYDAEATVCAKDGSIVFTSLRDGDIDLYRMDADGKNVRRLTATAGYDGGAFFNADCTKIVWRASRPKSGKELEDFRRLLAQDPPLVRPSKLELYVANADGSDAQQITYLDAASFAPFWHPSQKRILFSSNFGDPKGREFDIWAIDTNGARLERITQTPGFDGFPMFSPDGKTLAFSSNRATAEGKHDTNVFLARWRDDGGTVQETGADRILKDIGWLADPQREGRGVGMAGLESAGGYVEERMKALGLAPAGDGGFRQPFKVVTQLRPDPAVTSVRLGDKALDAGDFSVLGYSPEKASVTGDMVFAEYGIVDGKRDDYTQLDARKRVVVVRRFVPDDVTAPEAQRKLGDLRQKAFWAREHGAAALVIVDDPPGEKAPNEAPLPSTAPEGFGDAGLPVIVVKRASGHPIIERLKKKEKVAAKVAVQLTKVSTDAFNVLGKLVAEGPNKLPGAIVIGAHYDHLGHGGRSSLAPGNDAAHLGADDNASGTATLLEVARTLAARKGELRRDIVFAAFSGEEEGVLGSAHLVHAWQDKNKKLGGIVAMLNMDMVGRMRENRLQVLGAETATAWKELVGAACDARKVDCAASGDGYGPSDQINFFSAGVPVLHFFTGTHGDYHKPSDTTDKINAAGAMATGTICANVALAVSQREASLGFSPGAAGPTARGDMRSFNASLGTVPDYGGPGEGKKGVLLAGVRPGGAAEKGGLRKGDILVRLGKSEIGSVEDLMFVLNASKPGETVAALVLRDGKEVKLEVTFQESTRPR